MARAPAWAVLSLAFFQWGGPGLLVPRGVGPTVRPALPGSRAPVRASRRNVCSRTDLTVTCSFACRHSVSAFCFAKAACIGMFWCVSRGRPPHDVSKLLSTAEMPGVGQRAGSQARGVPTKNSNQNRAWIACHSGHRGQITRRGGGTARQPGGGDYGTLPCGVGAGSGRKAPIRPPNGGRSVGRPRVHGSKSASLKPALGRGGRA